MGPLDRRGGGSATYIRAAPFSGVAPVPSSIPAGRQAERSMKWRHVILMLAGLAAVIWRRTYHPFPGPGQNPVLDLVAFHDPDLHAVIQIWYYAAPGVAVLLGGLICLSIYRVWFQPQVGGAASRGTLPAWPVSPGDPAPSIVVGEVHHPVEPREIARPSWLVIPEKGLYTGVLIFGAVGSGKTSACMHPFARQILSWQAAHPQRRPAGLVLEVKGDFCHAVRRILEEAKRGEDYLEIGLDGPWQWNPLDDPLLDSYSLAYTVSTLINQLFGKSREPFWQQAYTNLVRWIIELYRLLPGGWVTLRDVYRCTIDADLFASRIGEAQRLAAEVCPARVTISFKNLVEHQEQLEDWPWDVAPGEDKAACRLDAALQDRLAQLGIPTETERIADGAGSELRERVEAIERWYRNDWIALDNKLRSSIVEGISVFLSLFDLPQVAGVFCPPAAFAKRSPSASACEKRRCFAARPAPQAASLGRVDRVGQGPGPEHARRRQSGPLPRRRGAAQERLDAGLAAPPRRDRAPARALLSSGPVPLRRVPGLRLGGRGRSFRR